MVDVEKEHVHKVYSQIAAHFSDTRFKAWPQIAQFLQSQPPGSLIADVGELFLLVKVISTLYHIVACFQVVGMGNTLG